MPAIARWTVKTFDAYNTLPGGYALYGIPGKRSRLPRKGVSGSTEPMNAMANTPPRVGVKKARRDRRMTKRMTVWKSAGQLREIYSSHLRIEARHFAKDLRNAVDHTINVCYSMREEQNRLAKIESAVHEANLLRIYAKVMISTYDDDMASMCEEIGRKNVENVDRLRPPTMKEIFVTSLINLLALYNKDVKVYLKEQGITKPVLDAGWVISKSTRHFGLDVKVPQALLELYEDLVNGPALNPSLLCNFQVWE